MQMIKSGLSWFAFLPAPVMMIIIFLIVNFAIKMKPSKAIRSALLYGIGLYGLLTFTGIFGDTVSPLATAMVKRVGVQMKSIDYGIGIVGVILSNPIVMLSIPIGILWNVFLLSIKFTKTLDLDIFNILIFWGAPFILVYVNTKSIIYATIALLITGMMVLKLADWSAPRIHKVFPEYKGLSFPHLNAVFWTPLALWLNKLFDMIPIFKDWNVDEKYIRKHFGIFGEPAVIGLVLGALLAILAGRSVKDILINAVTMGGVMYFIPVMIRVLMEGLTSTATRLGELVKKRYAGKREIYIGLDAVLTVGHPETLAVGLLMVPFVFIEGIILPGNTTLPFGMLATGYITICLVMPLFRMNVVRGLIMGLIIMAINLYLASLAAPFYSAVAAAGDLPMGASQVTMACCPWWALCVPFFKFIAGIFGG